MGARYLNSRFDFNPFDRAHQSTFRSISGPLFVYWHDFLKKVKLEIHFKSSLGKVNKLMKEIKESAIIKNYE